LLSGKKRVTTYPPNSAALKMDDDIARTDAHVVGGHAACEEGLEVALTGTCGGADLGGSSRDSDDMPSTDGGGFLR
jgi:hypothetical protein